MLVTSDFSCETINQDGLNWLITSLIYRLASQSVASVDLKGAHCTPQTLSSELEKRLFQGLAEVGCLKRTKIIKHQVQQFG